MSIISDLDDQRLARMNELSARVQQLEAQLAELQAEYQPVGTRLTTECPTCKEQVTALEIEPFATECSDCKIDRLESQLAATNHAAQVLLFALGVDGLLHNEPCDCHLCKAVQQASAALSPTEAGA